MSGRDEFEEIMRQASGRRRLVPEYSCWKHMVRRCTSERDPDYDRYGARGIRVCERWLGADGFRHFLIDLGRKPTSAHTLDRIDNDGNYEPGNVRWATRAER